MYMVSQKVAPSGVFADFSETAWDFDTKCYKFIKMTTYSNIQKCLHWRRKQSKRWVLDKPDDVLTDVNFENNNSHNDFR